MAVHRVDLTLLQAERGILEMVATGAPLRETLEALTSLIEARQPGLRCGILVVSVDGTRFAESYGPGLPAAYHQAFAGAAITPPYSGACGEVAHRGEPVFVADIAAAACYTEQWRDLLIACGLACVCSIPVTGPSGRVLGSFAMYHAYPRDPRPADPALIEIATHLAGIALERARDAKLAAARDARLQASARQFADMIENAPFGTYVVDADFRLALASQSARNTFGIDGLIGMDLGDALRKMWPESFASEAISRFRHTLATGETYTANDTVEQRRDIDAVEAYDWRIERIVMPDGRFGIVCYFYDLSGRQRMEAELRASEARFASAFEQAPSFMAMLSGPNHVIEIANPAYMKLIGHRAVLGRAVADALPEAVAQGYIGLLDRVYQTGKAYTAYGARYEVQAVPGGPAEERFLDFVYQPIADASGAINRIFVIGSDVTDRIEAARDLETSQERLRLAIAAGRLGLFDWDLRSGTLVWDDGLRAMWSVPDTAPVSIDTFYAGLHPDDVQRVTEVISRSHDPAGDGAYDVEYRVIGIADRQQRWVSARGRTLFQHGTPVRMIGVGVDVTALREAEAVLARSREELERLVDERTRELAETQVRLAHAQRMEALGQLAGGIAHDFNNVLQTVQGGAGLIEQRINDPAAVRRLARMVVDAANRGSAITQRLLAFSRRGDLRAEAVDPLLLLTDLQEILSHTLGSGITVRVAPAAGLPPLLADKGQLETVLINIATNARDAMGGSGALTLSASTAVLPDPDGLGPEPTLAPDSYVHLGVSDTGTGMTKEVLARVTEPFFTTKPPGQGTGLGLAMARGFVEQSGGRMLIESEPNKGTTVHIWLPAAPADSAINRTQPDDQANRNGKAARVLVVDDEPLVRDVITGQLEAAGYDVVPAADSRDALAILDAGERVELIVTDMSMP